MKKIAVINQKGGVGKTTITTNLSHALALNGSRVTAIDLDPQGHLAASLGIFRPPLHGIADVLLEDALLESVIVETRESLRLIPSGGKLRQVEEGGGHIKERMHLLSVAFEAGSIEDDYVLLDCPPSSGLLVANAILAVDEIVIPVSGDYLSLNGLAHLMITLKRFDAIRERPIKKWIVLSRFVARRRLSREVLQKLKEHFPEMILQTPIREAAALAECPSVGRTIFEYRATSGSSDDFRQLAQDLENGNVLQ